MLNRSPVQIRCMRQGAPSWCTGMTQSDGMGTEVGRGSGWRTHVNPWLIHVNVWQKPLQYCKVIQFSSATQSSLTLCEPMNCSTAGLHVHHQLPEPTQTHVH